MQSHAVKTNADRARLHTPRELILGLFNLAIGSNSEMLDEAFTAAPRASAAIRVIDAQIDQITFGLGRWPIERRLLSGRKALRLKAHQIVANGEGTDCTWVHAHLHRVEGALRQCPTGDLAIEWAAIAATLLEIKRA